MLHFKVRKALSARGMLQNSIIIFSTDNGGPANNFGGNFASNYPLRGMKRTLWEGESSSFAWILFYNICEKTRTAIINLSVSKYIEIK